jgi:hypothetical protein
MRTFSVEMVLKNKFHYDEGGIRFFQTLAHDLFFASAMAEFYYDHFKDYTKLKIFEIGVGNGSFSIIFSFFPQGGYVRM